MGIRTRVLALIIFTLFFLILATSFVSSQILLTNFTSIERSRTELNVERVRSAIAVEKENLATKISDWAIWDDTYQYIQDRNQEYEQNNLQPIALENLKINLMIFVDKNGTIVSSRAFDLETKQPVELSPDILSAIYPGSVILAKNETDTKAGFFPLIDNTLLFASAPILSSSNELPMEGTIIFGRYFDDTQLARIAAVTKSSLHAYQPAYDILDPEMLAVKSALLQSNQPYIWYPSDQKIYAYFHIPAVDQTPGIFFTLSSDREIYALGKQSILSIIASLLFIGVFTTAMVAINVDRSIVSPLLLLKTQIDTITRNRDIHQRIETRSFHSEFLELSHSINTLLQTLESAQHELNKKTEDLEKMNQMMVGRELKMSELKQKVKQIEEKISE